VLHYSTGQCFWCTKPDNGIWNFQSFNSFYECGRIDEVGETNSAIIGARVAPLQLFNKLEYDIIGRLLDIGANYAIDHSNFPRDKIRLSSTTEYVGPTYLAVCDERIFWGEQQFHHGIPRVRFTVTKNGDTFTVKMELTGVAHVVVTPDPVEMKYAVLVAIKSELTSGDKSKQPWVQLYDQDKTLPRVPEEALATAEAVEKFLNGLSAYPTLVWWGPIVKALKLGVFLSHAPAFNIYLGGTMCFSEGTASGCSHFRMSFFCLMMMDEDDCLKTTPATNNNWNYLFRRKLSQRLNKGKIARSCQNPMGSYVGINSEQDSERFNPAEVHY